MPTEILRLKMIPIRESQYENKTRLTIRESQYENESRLRMIPIRESQYENKIRLTQGSKMTLLGVVFAFPPAARGTSLSAGLPLK